MTPSLSPLHDPADLAQAVRDLASDAHRLLNNPTVSEFEVRELAERISSLQIDAQGQTSDDLTRWLDSARRRIDTA